MEVYRTGSFASQSANYLLLTYHLEWRVLKLVQWYSATCKSLWPIYLVFHSNISNFVKLNHYSVSQWTWRHLTSPASWLFAQPFVQAYIKENINRESAALLAFVREIHCDFPSQRASNRENVSIWWCQQVTEIQKVYYCKTSSISRTKSQSLNVSCILLQVSLLNPLKPGVKLIMKM